MSVYSSRSQFYKMIALFLFWMLVNCVIPAYQIAKITTFSIFTLGFVGFYLLSDNLWMEAKVCVFKKIYGLLIMILCLGFTGAFSDFGAGLSPWKPITFTIMAILGMVIWYRSERKYLVKNVDLLKKELKIDIARRKIILPLVVGDVPELKSRSKHEWWIYYTGGLIGVTMNGVLQPNVIGIILFTIALLIGMLFFPAIGSLLADLMFIIKLEKETGKRFIAEDKD